MGRVVIPGFRKVETSGGGEGGTTNYNDLTNKPSINNVPLVGNLNTVNLKLTDATLTEEGVPAESKTVGTKLEEQSTSLAAVKEELTKKANISDIPSKVSELQNDSNYQTDTDVTTALTNYATKTYVGEQISSADHLKREIVTEIPSPETADKNTIYMLKIESATGDDKYKEYLLIDGTVQCIGDTSVDLTDYAKKTEIPTELPANGGNSLTVNGHTVKSDVPENAVFTDTVYDDTEVKESIEELNSNLDTLELSDIAGGKNLFKYNEVSGTLSKTVECSLDAGTYTISALVNSSDTDSSTSLIVFYYEDENSVSYLLGRESRTSHTVTLTKHVIRLIFYASKDWANSANDTFTYSDIQIEKGTTATDYEPYIPSVKMLAEEVDNVNESLSAQIGNGINDVMWAEDKYINSSGVIGDASGFHYSDLIPITKTNYTYYHYSTVNNGASTRIIGYDKSGNFKSLIKEYGNTRIGFVNTTFDIPNDVYFIRISEFSNFHDRKLAPAENLQTQVTQIKNDLDKLNSLPIGSIIQIEAAKDNIETTTQKYGWQYLGTSKIECESGSSAAKLLLTNVYRKNN